MAVQREVQHLQPQQKFICRLIIVLAYLRNYTLQKFANNFLIKFILFLNVRICKNFSLTSKIFTKILGLLWRKKVMEKQLENSFHYCNSTKCQPLCWIAKMKRYLYWYIGSLRILTNSYTATSCKESVVSSLFNSAYFIIINKDDLYKENARIKQVLKKNGYQESIISKIFKRITNNHTMPQSQ